MLIQIWHSRSSDFARELYEPIKIASFFLEHTWIFPHDGAEIDSRESLRNIDLFIAEVSHPATWLGIEIGFASAYEKYILCIYKKWSKISSSLQSVTQDFIEYKNDRDMIEKLWKFLTSNNLS